MTPDLWGTFPLVVLKIMSLRKETQPIGHSLLEMVVPWAGLKQVPSKQQPSSPIKTVELTMQLQNERKVMAERLANTQNNNQADVKSLPAIIVVDDDDKQEAVVTATAPRRPSNSSQPRRSITAPSSSVPMTPTHTRKFPISTKPVVSILGKPSTGNRITWQQDVKDTFGPSKYRAQDSRRERETRNTDKVKLRIKLSELAELEEDCLRSHPVEDDVWIGWKAAHEVVPSAGPPLPGFRHETYNCIHPSAWKGTLFQYLVSEMEAESRRSAQSIPTPPPTTALVKIPVKPRPKVMKLDSTPTPQPHDEEFIDLTEF
eukprot:TRINITY_DN19903_c0_g1_i1.p1 TRINITY_DN19903_c0_g1~~TRINITY_DN19903_c0_g1_i1.p1  ORF type:complete len:316 (+),score=76.17 TRINITY_DN19903_c0_g1_i1:111-1058(+)